MISWNHYWVNCNFFFSFLFPVAFPLNFAAFYVGQGWCLEQCPSRYRIRSEVNFFQAELHVKSGLRASSQFGRVASSHSRTAHERRRECEGRGKKGNVVTISHTFSFAPPPPPPQKPQETTKRENWHRKQEMYQPFVSCPYRANPNAPVTLAF